MMLLIHTVIDGTQIDLYDPRPAFSGYLALNAEVGVPLGVDWATGGESITHHGRCVVIHGVAPEAARQAVDEFEAP